MFNTVEESINKVHLQKTKNSLPMRKKINELVHNHIVLKTKKLFPDEFFYSVGFKQ